MFSRLLFSENCLHFRTKHMRLFQYMHRYRSYFCSFIICWLEGHPVVINDPAFPAVTSSKFIPLAVAKHPCDKNMKSFDTTPQARWCTDFVFSTSWCFLLIFYVWVYLFFTFLNEIWMCLLLRVPGPQSHRLTLRSLMLGRKHYCCYIKQSNTIFYIEILLLFFKAFSSPGWPESGCVNVVHVCYPIFIDVLKNSSSVIVLYSLPNKWSIKTLDGIGNTTELVLSFIVVFFCRLHIVMGFCY